MIKESNIFIGLKKTCLGVLEREDRDKDSETGLKEGGGIEMSTTVLPLRDARSFAKNTYRCSIKIVIIIIINICILKIVGRL